ncbi:AraC family transcriptional regulator [Rhizobium sp. RAF36]|uniref:AraC family transcriptional regulator n=1 Tax=Rhizobium sp. RAF36 TaxID=3233055 RepID=UPI000DD593D1
MDPLSDILALLQPKSVETYGVMSGGEWALDFPRSYEGIKFGAVARGGCFLRVSGEPAPFRLEEGDCYLLTGQPYWLGSDLSLAGIDARAIFVDLKTRVARHGPQEDIFLVGGRLMFDASHQILLTGALPAVMHIPAAADEAAVLRWTLKQLAKELTELRPGGLLMSEHLGHILFVNALRLHMAAEGEVAPGWLKGLNDPRIGRALRAVHAEPARRWTLEVLAKEAGMSRTAFALHFKALVGWPPLDYLLRWRMRLAARALLSPERNRLSDIALSVGYESESAFSAAFKRAMGCSPKHYQGRAKQPV